MIEFDFVSITNIIIINLHFWHSTRGIKVVLQLQSDSGIFRGKQFEGIWVQ